MTFLRRAPRFALVLAYLPLMFFLASLVWLIFSEFLIPTGALTPGEEARALRLRAAADLVRLGLGLLALIAWGLFLAAASREPSLDRHHRVLWCLGILAFPWGAMPAFAGLVQRNADSPAASP